MMDNQARTNQGGSVASFIVVGIILTAVVIAGIYFVHQRNQVTTDTNRPTSPVASSPTGPNAPVPSPSQSPQTTPQPAQPSPQAPQPPAVNHNEAPLPATGPSEDFLGFVGLSLLVGVTISYIRSRQTLPRSASTLD